MCEIFHALLLCDVLHTLQFVCYIQSQYSVSTKAHFCKCNYKRGCKMAGTTLLSAILGHSFLGNHKPEMTSLYTFDYSRINSSDYS